ncbi:septal ring lytic transglycosylase RlpA family protein [Pseudomonas sp. SH1-B]
MMTRSPDAIRETATSRIASGLQTCALLGALALLGGCSTFGGGGSSETGKASYYAQAHHGKRTASGERFDQNALTAAHRTLPFGTRVRVTNLNNERSVVLRINDRGPFVRGRVIDVSRAAAERLDMLRAGVVPVRIEPLD